MCSELRRQLQELSTQVICALTSSSPGTRIITFGLEAPAAFPSTAAVFCPGVLLQPQARAGSGVCCRCFPPFSPGSQQEMWEERQQQTPLELLHPSVSSVVPDGAGSCAGHRAMWAHRRGYGRLGRALPPQPVQPVFRAAASRMPIGSLPLFSGDLFPLESLALCLLFWAWFCLKSFLLHCLL